MKKSDEKIFSKKKSFWGSKWGSDHKMGPKMDLCHFYKKMALRILFQMLLNDAQYCYKPFSEDGMS